MKFLILAAVVLLGVYGRDKRGLIINLLTGGTYTTYLPCCKDMSRVESLINETQQLELSVQSCEDRLREAENKLNGSNQVRRSGIQEEKNSLQDVLTAFKRAVLQSFDYGSQLLELPLDILTDLLGLIWKTNNDLEMAKKCCKIMRALDEYLEHVKQLRSTSEICNEKVENLTARVDEILNKPKCPAGFSYSDNSKRCYTVLPNPGTYDEGQQRCGEIGGVLASVRSQEDQNFIEILANALPKSGACTCNRGGSCYTTSGQTFDVTKCGTGDGRLVWKPKTGYYMEIVYTNWKAGEPNCYGGNEHCIVLDSFFNYQWNDYPCSTKTCPICEVDAKQVHRQ